MADTSRWKRLLTPLSFVLLLILSLSLAKGEPPLPV